MAASECDAILGQLMDALDDEDATEARSLLRSARREQCLDKGTSGAMVRAVGKGDFDRAREDLDRAVQLGDLHPQRDQPRLGEGERERDRTTRRSRAENPEQGQTQFGEGGEVEGQGRLGGGLAGPRDRDRRRDRDDDRRRETRGEQGTLSGGTTEREREREREREERRERRGARSLREFAQERDNGDDDEDSR